MGCSIESSIYAEAAVDGNTDGQQIAPVVSTSIVGSERGPTRWDSLPRYRGRGSDAMTHAKHRDPNTELKFRGVIDADDQKLVTGASAGDDQSTSRCLPPMRVLRPRRATSR